jgi:MinD-like ATPase involved in chromosome partitioning or flagellar assembly
MAMIGVFSARADGATTIAVGMAAVLSARARTLLIDLNLDSPEIAPLLDLDASRNVFHLAYNAQLAQVAGDELEEHVAWRDGLAVLPGLLKPDQAERISDHFLTGLMQAAGQRFQHVVIDLGRVRSGLPAPMTAADLCWVVIPSPLGMDALERSFGRLEEAGYDWLKRTRIVLNRVHAGSLAGADRYAATEHGLATAASIPDTPDYWRRVEVQHSPRALSVPEPEHPRYKKVHGDQALVARRAIEALTASIVPDAEPVTEPALRS